MMHIFHRLLICFSLVLFALPGFSQFIQLIGHHPGDTLLNYEVWGYEDSVTGKPYALMGNQKGVLIYDVSNPINPVLTSTVEDIVGFDMKVWDHYLYVVTGNDADSLFIVDLIDIANPVRVGSILPGAHNIWIDEKGYLYATHNTIRIFDLNADPTRPNRIWQGGVDGHDIHVFGDTMIYFAGYNGTYLFDVTDRQFPIPYGLVFDPNMVYHHSGWLTPDGSTLFICDELAKGTSADISAWDITDPDNPARLGDFTDTSSIVHNLYLKDRFAFTSFYKRGLRIFDVDDPGNIHLVGEYKTYPGTVEETFGGAFGAYIFAPGGYVYVSDMQAGLFIFEVDLALNTPEPSVGAREPFLLWPNPASTTLNFELLPQRTGIYTFEILDSQGKQVYQSVQYWQKQQPATEKLNLSGLNAGLYFLVVRDPVGQLAGRQKFIVK